MIFAFPLILIALLLEASALSLPLTLVTIVTLSFFYNQRQVLFLAAFFGILLEILLLQTIGISTIFFLIAVFLLFLYKRKIEDSKQVVFIINLITAVLYALIIKGTVSFFEPLTVAIFGLAFFVILTKFKTLKNKNNNLSFNV